MHYILLRYLLCRRKHLHFASAFFWKSQNLLWGAKESAQSYDDYVSDELGLDGFEVDAHAGCRPTHEFMQGKLYSYNGRKKVNGIVYEDGSEALERLKDYGCLHFKTGVLLGVSEPRYSQEELERIHRETTEKIEYNGKEKTLYEWKQTQRRLERAHRTAQNQEDIFKASGNNIVAKDYRNKANAIKSTYDDLTNSVPGLYDHSERMRTYFNSTKSLTSAGRGGIIKIASPISSRKHPTGTPEGIELFGDDLNSRQLRLLDKLMVYDSEIEVHKKSVSMRDLSALTAHENVEFAMFTKGNKRLIIRGDPGSVNVDKKRAKELSKQGYKWSGHTHPGSTDAVLFPSDGDMEILKCFNQSKSVTYNSVGNHYVFGETEK